MPDQPASNVKIYDRPERKGPSPLILIIGIIITLMIAFFSYKMFYHPATSASTPLGMLSVSSVLWHDRGLQ